MSSVVPDGWSVYTLGELGQVVGGGTPPSETLSYWGGSVMWVTPAEITKLKSRYINKTLRTITKEGLQKSSAKLHPKGTILLTSRASIGYPAINSVPMATNQGFQSLRPNEKLDVEYGYQLILNNRNGLERLSAGSTFLEISSKEINKYKLPIPPLPEQKKIASILTSVDEVIENTQKQIDKLKDLKKATMNELLTKGIGHTEFKDSELGRIPEGWIRGRLDSVVSKFIVPMRDKPKTFSGDIPWVRIEDFYGKYLSGSKSGRNVDRTTINDMNLKVYPKGTVLCSCSARLGVCTITSTELVSNQTFIGLYPSDSIDAEMLFYTMESHSEDLQKLSSGTTIAYLPREKFEEFEILVPPLPEQKKIASILTSVDEVIENTQKQIDKLQSLKKSLMQDLLTGKVRVSVN